MFELCQYKCKKGGSVLSSYTQPIFNQDTITPIILKNQTK